MKKAWLVVCLFLLSPLALAQDGVQIPDPRLAAPLETEARQAVLIEAATGDTLFAKDADTPMPTSSMSKVMTMYLVFEAIRNGKLNLSDELTISDNAWKQEGSRMFLKAGAKAKVEDLIRGVIVQSGNDAAVVLAEALGETEPQFAAMMNAKAQELGMLHSHFANATGLPAPDHYATPRDLAMLGLAIIRDFPEEYAYYAEKEFTYNNIKQGNRNPLLYRDAGVDGLKTGHTEAAGYGLMASAVRDGRRLIMVANGMENMQVRADESAKILDWGYREFGLYPVLRKDMKMADATVWLGTQPSVPLMPEKDLTLSLSRNARNGLQVTLSYEQPLTAPVQAGQVAGNMLVDIPGKEVVRIRLLTGAAVEQVGFFDKLLLKLKLLLSKV
jgi:D-alanyl-D-alanine carboxypeptidase (penicillin-binding protein 5/6)